VWSGSSRQLTSRLRTVRDVPLDVLESRHSRQLQINAPLGSPGEETSERDESFSYQIDSPHERTVIIPHAEQVDRTASIQVFNTPLTPPSPLDRHTTYAPQLLPQSSAWGKMMDPSPLHMQKSMLPYEPMSPSRQSPFELPHPPGEDRGKGRLDEQGKDPSTGQHGPPAPSEHSPAATEPPMQGHRDPSATLHRSPASPERIPATTLPTFRQERSPSSIQRRLPIPPEHFHAMTELPSLRASNDPSATSYKQPVPPPALERKERKRVMVHEERENQLENCADAEPNPNPTTSSAPDVIQDSKPPLEGSVQQTYSLYHRREPDSSALYGPYLPNSRINPRPQPLSLPGDSQTLATSSSMSSIVYNDL
jgi:hypothetical protein